MLGAVLAHVAGEFAARLKGTPTPDLIKAAKDRVSAQVVRHLSDATPPTAERGGKLQAGATAGHGGPVPALVGHGGP